MDAGGGPTTECSLVGQTVRCTREHFPDADASHGGERSHLFLALDVAPGATLDLTGSLDVLYVPWRTGADGAIEDERALGFMPTGSVGVAQILVEEEPRSDVLVGRADVEGALTPRDDGCVVVDVRPASPALHDWAGVACP